jgi:hypothetical protein
MGVGVAVGSGVTEGKTVAVAVGSEVSAGNGVVVGSGTPKTVQASEISNKRLKIAMNDLDGAD